MITTVAIVLGTIVWLLPIYLGLSLAEKKGVSRKWMLFGLHPFSAWIGYLIISKKEALVACPKCLGKVDPKAEVCRHCRSELEVQDGSIHPNSGFHYRLALLLGPGIIVAGLIASFFIREETGGSYPVNAYWLYESPMERLKSDSTIVARIGETIESQYLFNHSQAGEEMIIKFKVIGEQGNGWVKAFMHNEASLWITDSLRFVDSHSRDTIWLKESLEIQKFLNDSTKL